jgi:hypothetical protein
VDLASGSRPRVSVLKPNMPPWTLLDCKQQLVVYSTARSKAISTANATFMNLLLLTSRLHAVAS